MTDNEDDQRALGMLQSAMNLREIFTKTVLGASPESLETICECLLEYTKVIAAEHGRPQANYLWGAANPATEERFTEDEAVAYKDAVDFLFHQARADNFIEGVATASGLQSMATLIHAEQVARSKEVKLAIFSKKYEMSRVVDLVFKMDRENKAKSSPE